MSLHFKSKPVDGADNRNLPDRRSFMQDLCLAAAGFALGGCQAADSNLRVAPKLHIKEGLEVGQKLPDVVLPGLNGADIQLSSLLGTKLVLVEFWASYCGACRGREMPSVVREYDKHTETVFRKQDGSVAGKGLDVYAVSIDNNEEDWRNTIAQRKYNISSHVFDSQGIISSGKYGVESVPDNFLLDQQGIIIGRNITNPKLYSTLKDMSRI